MSRATLTALILLLAACSNGSRPAPQPAPPPLSGPTPANYVDVEPDYVAGGEDLYGGLPGGIVTEEQVRLDRTRTQVRYMTEKPQPNCGQPYVATNTNWFPGLPWTPLTKPRLTGLTVEGAAFTDGGRDRLLPFAIQQLQDNGENPAGREFANQIDDVSVYTEIDRGAIEARFVYLGDGKPQPVILAGQFRGGEMSDRVNVVLTQAGKRRGFAGRATCADVTGGCENILLTIKRLGARGETTAEAKVVHRFGSAHVQVAPEDQFEFTKYKNAAHRQLAEYLSNTVNNSCLAVLYAIRTGQRQEEACTIQKLEKECGRNQVRYPSAQVFGIRTWAIVYGRSGFEFNAQDKASKVNAKQDVRFLIAGPLLTGANAPVAPGLHVEGAIGVLKADMIANDGAGSFNVQLVFSGEPRSHTRVSIATLFERTRKELQGNGVATAAVTPDWVK